MGSQGPLRDDVAARNGDDESVARGAGRASHPHEGRLVEDDEGVREDTTKEVVANVATGDTAWKSAEESAVHIIEEDSMQESDLVDLDALPEDPDDR